MSPLPHAIARPRPRGVAGVNIRSISTRDAPVLRRLLRDNRTWLSPWEATFPDGGAANTGAASLRPVIRELHRQRRRGIAVTFVVCSGAELVGQVSVSEISAGALRSASIGYWLAKHAAGKGIMPAAVALAIDYAFTELLLHRIEICIRPENLASLRVAQKLGLRYEGRRERYIHIAGQWRDHESFAVTAEELANSEVPDGGMVARLTIAR